jgi:hypothetical protein
MTDSELAAPASWPVRCADSVIIVFAELTKSVLRESWGLAGQLINWGAQHAVSLIAAPGYRAAVRARSEQVDEVAVFERNSVSQQLEIPCNSSALRAATDGSMLLNRSNYVAYRGQPTPRNRTSPGLVSEAKLSVLTTIDAAARSLRICIRSPVLFCCSRFSRHRSATLTGIPAAVPSAPASAPSHLPQSLSGSTTHVLISSICGCPAQEYRVRTADGYLLTLLRIPRVEATRVALFQHGLVDTAAAWVSTGSVFSLAARAHQQGYDVFLGNLRGTDDAMAANGIVLGGSVGIAPSVAPLPQHERLLPQDGPFWDYSVDDHALDVMAHMLRIRCIKALERPLRNALRVERAERVSAQVLKCARASTF